MLCHVQEDREIMPDEFCRCGEGIFQPGLHNIRISRVVLHVGLKIQHNLILVGQKHFRKKRNGIPLVDVLTAGGKERFFICIQIAAEHCSRCIKGRHH